jgi:glycine/D-amino acid oxidase-like deaminating enzyme
VLVIGAGFWGTAISLALREAGRQVLCLDSSEPGAASAAAAGLVRQSTLDRLQQAGPAWWTEHHSSACQDFLGQPWMRACKERVVSPYRPEGRMRTGLWCADCSAFLGLARAQPMRVIQLLRQSHGWRVLTEQHPLLAGQVVLAAGVFCDDLLRASHLPALGLRGIPGSGLLAPAEVLPQEALTQAYRLPGDTRTRTATARAWGDGEVRAGDTLGTDEEAQLRVIQSLLQQAGGRGPIRRLWGIRPDLPQLVVEKIAPDLVVASGGRRTGLASAPGVARRVRELLQ